MFLISKTLSSPEFKILAKELRKQRGIIFIGILAAVIASSISVVIPYLYGRLTDLALSGEVSLATIAGAFGFWLLIDILQGLLHRFVSLTSTKLSSAMWGSLVVDAATHLLELPLAFHREKKMGKVLNRITRGLDEIWEVFENVVFSLAPDFLALFFALAVSLFVEWRMASTLFIMIVIYAFLSIKMVQPIIKEQPKMHRAWEHAYGELWDSVLNVETVKSQTAERFERRKLSKEFSIANVTYRRWMALWQNMSFWQGMVFAFGFVAIFASGVLLMRQGVLSPGKLLMFIGYMNLATSPLARLANQYRQIRRAVIGIKRSLSVFKVKPESDLPGATDIGALSGEVVFDQVSFRYGKKQPILKDISFKVKPGEVVAFVGESGVGKTTMTNLLLRYWLPEKGKIYVDGKDISKITYRSLRKQMAVVPQEVILFNDTVKNNIRYGKADATDQEIISAAKVANAHEFIEKFPKKYDQLVGERGIKLSTGQKQRVAIARAILRNPRILILDEATAALDSASEKLVQEALWRLIKGKTTFIIAHRLSTIAKADKIIVLEKGRVVESGTHRQLIEKRGLYFKFWNLQTSLGKKAFDEKAQV